jgi:hypothetical protein
MGATEIEILRLPNIYTNDPTIAIPTPIATHPTLQILSTKEGTSSNGPHCKARSEPDLPQYLEPSSLGYSAIL